MKFSESVEFSLPTDGQSLLSSTRDDQSTNGDDASSYSPFVDEEFLKHYNVKEIQNNVVNSLVDEEFLRHYRVDEIAANMGFNAPYTGNYGYDYFMGGECTLPPYDLLSHTLSYTTRNPGMHRLSFR